jgi:hypothetical protein
LPLLTCTAISAPNGSRGRLSSVIPKLSTEGSENVQTIKHFLTMGHQYVPLANLLSVMVDLLVLTSCQIYFRLQEISYDPSSDTIEVVRFNEKNAQNDESNTFKYQVHVLSLGL